jgi:hypothetical protein
MVEGQRQGDDDSVRSTSIDVPPNIKHSPIIIIIVPSFATRLSSPLILCCASRDLHVVGWHAHSIAEVEPSNTPHMSGLK